MDNKSAHAIGSPWFLKLKHFEYVAHAESVFSSAECEKIKEIFAERPSIDARISEEGNMQGIIDTSIRKSTVKWGIGGESELDWVFRRCTDAVEAVNKQFWNFDLDYIEILQYTIYSQSGDNYTMHTDLLLESPHYRKLSFSIQLCDDSDYEGCDLDIMLSTDSFIKTTRNKGAMIVFPSFVMHQANPIISGERHSLVGWVCGPNFK